MSWDILVWIYTSCACKRVLYDKIYNDLIFILIRIWNYIGLRGLYRDILNVLSIVVY